MTTYQDIIDYLKGHYLDFKEYTVIEHGDCYTITNGDITIDIYNDCYKSSLYIGTKLSRLLADLLDTPVNQRNKPEIKHTVKPVSKENLELHDAPILDTNDEIINRINSFILSDWSADHNRTLILVSSFINRGLEEVFKLFKDFNFTIEDSHDYIDGFGAPCGWVYILSIKAK